MGYAFLQGKPCQSLAQRSPVVLRISSLQATGDCFRKGRTCRGFQLGSRPLDAQTAVIIGLGDDVKMYMEDGLMGC